jgi:hypothetical protein
MSNLDTLNSILWTKPERREVEDSIAHIDLDINYLRQKLPQSQDLRPEELAELYS